MSTQVPPFRSLALALVVFGLSACASAPTEEGAVAAADLDPVVCKKDADTGSRLAKKKCKKQSEWDLIAEENERMRRNLERGSAAGSISDGTRQ